MKYFLLGVSLILIIALLAGCGPKKRHYNIVPVNDGVIVTHTLQF